NPQGDEEVDQSADDNVDTSEESGSKQNIEDGVNNAEIQEPINKEDADEELEEDNTSIEESVSKEKQDERQEIQESTNNRVSSQEQSVEESSEELTMEEKEMLIAAQQSPNASEKFNLYLEGYKINRKSEFKEGIASSASNILNLGKKYHRDGKLDAAISYYEKIIGVEEVPGETKRLAKDYKEKAKADKIYKKAKESEHKSDKLKNNIEGNKLYTNDNR